MPFVRSAAVATDDENPATLRQANLLLLLAQLPLKQVKVEAHALNSILHLECISLIQPLQGVAKATSVLFCIFFFFLLLVYARFIFQRKAFLELIDAESEPRNRILVRFRILVDRVHLSHALVMVYLLVFFFLAPRVVN